MAYDPTDYLYQVKTKSVDDKGEIRWLIQFETRNMEKAQEAAREYAGYKGRENVRLVRTTRDQYKEGFAC